MLEAWRPIVGYEGLYEVSSEGRVRSRRGAISPWLSKNGYLIVGLWKHGRPSTRQVHRLVLAAFSGPPDGLVCRHLDGNPRNNSLPNLKWGTARENHEDAVRHGTHVKPPKLIQKGELNHAVKLTREQVGHIRQRNMTAKELASMYGITQWTVFDIRKGRSWTEGIA